MTPDDLKLIADCEERCQWGDNNPVIPGYLLPLVELAKRLAKELEEAYDALRRASPILLAHGWIERRAIAHWCANDLEQRCS